MPGVVDEPLLRGVHGFEAVEHLVEGGCHGGDVICPVDRHPRGEIVLADVAGDAVDLTHGGEDLAGHEPGDA